MQFDSDAPGIFIRAEDALSLALILRDIRTIVNVNRFPCALIGLTQTIALLERCDGRQGIQGLQKVEGPEQIQRVRDKARDLMRINEEIRAENGEF